MCFDPWPGFDFDVHAVGTLLASTSTDCRPTRWQDIVSIDRRELCYVLLGLLLEKPRKCCFFVSFCVLRKQRKQLKLFRPTVAEIAVIVVIAVIEMFEVVEEEQEGRCR